MKKHHHKEDVVPETLNKLIDSPTKNGMTCLIHTRSHPHPFPLPLLFPQSVLPPLSLSHHQNKKKSSGKKDKKDKQSGLSVTTFRINLGILNVQHQKSVPVFVNPRGSFGFGKPHENPHRERINTMHTLQEKIYNTAMHANANSLVQKV